MTISVVITAAMLERTKDAKAFRNSLTGTNGPTDYQQRCADVAELCVQQYLIDCGVHEVRVSFGAERALFDIVANGVRIDVKDSSHPVAGYLIYPATKHAKLTCDAPGKLDVLIATRSHRFPEAIDIIGAITLKRFLQDMEIAGQEASMVARYCAPDFYPGTMYLEFEALSTIDQLVASLIKRNPAPDPWGDMWARPFYRPELL